MSNFNKSNPYVILINKEYDEILNFLERQSKKIVKYFIWMGINLFLAIALYIAVGILNEHWFRSIAYLIVFIYLDARIIYSHRDAIGLYMHSHPAMLEFAKLSKLEVNDIIAMDNVDILNARYRLCGMRGAMEADFEYRFKIQFFIMIAQVALMLRTVLMLLGIPL
jgi:hypothetical protein